MYKGLYKHNEIISTDSISASVQFYDNCSQSSYEKVMVTVAWSAVSVREKTKTETKKREEKQVSRSYYFFLIIKSKMIVLLYIGHFLVTV